MYMRLYIKDRAMFIVRVYLAGWESQLLETGFLAIFMCPLFSLTRLPRHTPTSWAVIWGYRWLIFRIMLGAVRGRHTVALLHYN